MSKQFTLAEAQDLIPKLKPLIEKAIASKSRYAEADGVLDSFSQRILMMGGLAVDRERVLDTRRRRDAAAGALRETIEQIQETGCVVKDLDIGLVDFPASLGGREVYLCWKLGEDSIRFWHGTDEGFGGRKPIGGEFE